jgi:hypothetical protein
MRCILFNSIPTLTMRNLNILETLFLCLAVYGLLLALAEIVN